MLQEVHCSENTADLWACEWGYKTLFSCCSSNKAGVSIIFNNTFNLQILKVFSDPSGRFIICDIEANSKPLTLANIYAPNEDDPNFFRAFFDHLSSFHCEEIIIGGDFNLVLDLDKDKKGGLAKTHKNALKVVQDLSESLELSDVWRILNPEATRYTWHQRQPDIHCRLDFFLVSQSSICNITQADTIPRFKTDHSMITLSLSLHSNPRGKGFWKLNTSSLSDARYLEEIRKTIQETVIEYENNVSVNPALLWEMVKLKVREKSISYAAYHKSATTKRENELENTITILQKQLDMAKNNEPQNQSIIERINLLKRDLEKIIEHRTKGAILRSKSQWYNERERNTKYFLNLEKRHFKQGTISQLKINETDFVTCDKAILSECESFYKHLYTSKVNNDFASHFFQQANETILSHEEQNFCEGFLFEKECAEAVKSMDSNKTPGTDGLPAEFYKIFWKDISTLLVSALNYAFEFGCLSTTQRRGVIKLIPKKDAELYYIKNWRPITLLNTDYKIAAKALANRIKYAAKENIPGLLLFIDFEKAFDSLEWSFIVNSLRFFGFGPSIINWVKVLYCKTESCVLNNGWSTNFFQTLRGVRQGCPLSPYLFIHSAEVLAKVVKNNVNIKGISIDNNEIKISQYADDTTLILDGSREVLASALNLLDDFSKVSGLSLNNKKTEALWIGSSIGNEQLILPGSGTSMTSLAHPLILDKNFIHFCSTYHPALKYTFEISESSVPFLDLCVSIFNNRVATTIHYKATDTTTSSIIPPTPLIAGTPFHSVNSSVCVGSVLMMGTMISSLPKWHHSFSTEATPEA